LADCFRLRRDSLRLRPASAGGGQPSFSTNKHERRGEPRLCRWEKEERTTLGITRRAFLERGGLVTMALAMRQGMSSALSHAMSHPAPAKFRTQLNASSLAQFVDPLPLPEILRPTGHRTSPDDPKIQLPYYRVAMRQFESKLHRDMKPTRLWGYASASPG